MENKTLNLKPSFISQEYREALARKGIEIEGFPAESKYKEIIGKIVERANEYREMARMSRIEEDWPASDSENGKASGLFIAAKIIREYELEKEK